MKNTMILLTTLGLAPAALAGNGSGTMGVAARIKEIQPTEVVMFSRVNADHSIELLKMNPTVDPLVLLKVSIAVRDLSPEARVAVKQSKELNDWIQVQAPSAE